MAMPIVDLSRRVVGGVDTHLDVHVAAVVDSIGGVLGVASFAVDRAGYAALLSWMSGFGTVDRVGIEGTGSYGAGLSRSFAGAGIAVIEVDRPNRQERRRNGKSDELDAIEAARAALSGRARGRAKARGGNVEAIRALLVAKRSARSARIASIVQLRHLMFTAPDDVRERFARLRPEALVREAARLRPRSGADRVRHATKTTAVILARRVQSLDDEIALLDRQIAPLVKATAPALLDIYGVGIDTAATLLVAAGDNAERIRSEAAWAKLCGTSPVPANTGKRDNRFRLNSGGNRQANNALWHIVFTRLGQHEPRTVAYMQRRLAQGRTKPEIIRCLKRYVARETFSALPR
jgi:transposase